MEPIFNIELPLSVTLPRKRKADMVYRLNLNVYRNTHYHTLNQAKQLYKDQVAAAIYEQKVQPLEGVLRFDYCVYGKTRRAFDIANVLCVVEKFTDDALIELGIIPEDNFNYLPEVRYIFGGIDKHNPRVELTAYEYHDSETVTRKHEAGEN